MSTSATSAPTRRLLVALATAWGPKHGGINSFNHDLCVALAEVLEDHAIVCIVLDADTAAIADAKAQGVDLRSLARPKDTDFAPALAGQLATLLGTAFCANVDWWIGHDVKTGPIALALSEDHPPSRACVIKHMSFDDYSHAKNTHERARKAVAEQQAVLARPEIALAVGPLLFERLTEIRGTKTSIRLIPGLAEPLARVRGGRLSGAVFGRFEERENLIKQAPLAVAAFSRAVEEGRRRNVEYLADGIIRIFGIADDENAMKAMRSLAETHGAQANTLQPHPYIEDRAVLRAELDRVNLAMMLSLHEGFGLSGWEAIGMEIPLIVSKQSGLYRLLREVGGAATGCVMGVDVLGSSGDAPFQEKDVIAVKDEIVNFSLTPDFVEQTRGPCVGCS